MGRCILVLGTGRSGTSMVAGMLHALGVDMGTSFVPADRNNPFGSYEDAEWFAFTRQVLKGGEGGYQELIDERDGVAVWGVKDPALSLVAQHVLPHLEDVRIVAVRRPREECIRSFSRAYGWPMNKVLGWYDAVSTGLAERLEEYDGPVLDLTFDGILADPRGTAEQLAAFAFGDVEEVSQERIDRAAAHIRPRMDFDDQRVAIGHPLVGGAPTWALYKTIMDMDKPSYHKVILTRESGLPVDDARNEICRWFLERSDADWLLMTDGDAVLDRDTLRRMMSWDKPVVSALAFLRLRPVFPSLAVWDERTDSYRFAVDRVRDWVRKHELGRAQTGAFTLYPRPDDGLWPLQEMRAYTGCHCVLFKREALEAIGAPWFKRLKGPVGEDRFFFAKAQSKGVAAFVDTTSIVGHLAGEGFSLGVVDFLAWDALLGPQGWAEAHKLIK